MAYYHHSNNDTQPPFIVWQKLEDIIQISQDGDEKVAHSDYDNDPATLERERIKFQTSLTRINPLIRIDHLEKDKASSQDLFILNVESLKFVEQIQSLFKDNSVQYTVYEELFNVPLQGVFNANHDRRPLQYTLAIARRPLKRLNRSFFLNLVFASLYLFLFLALLVYFYRIVLV